MAAGTVVSIAGPAADGFATDPSSVLEQVFLRIQRTRMADLPFLNPALAVAAVGFKPRGGCWSGVLVTPWFMSCLLLPQQGGRWRALAVGESRLLRFPAGEFEFIGGFEPGLGDYQSCSLFSPLPQFADQASARCAARTALDTLFALPDPEAHGDNRPPGAVAAASMTRRDFLRGGRGR